MTQIEKLESKFRKIDKKDNKYYPLKEKIKNLNKQKDKKRFEEWLAR